MAVRRSGRFQRIKKPLNSDMNVVPYIDVMLVLLVIFMVTAPMITSGIKVDLPEANSVPIESKDAPAMVTLDQQGQYFLEYKGNQPNPLSLQELQQTLRDAQQIAERENKQFSVVINGHNTRTYGEVMTLMSNLQDAGINQVGLLTKPIQ